MRKARPYSPDDPRVGSASGVPSYGSQEPYIQAPHYYAIDSAEQDASYPLADETGYSRGTGAKRVATTLGRSRPQQPCHIVSVDPNARVASAIHPQTIPAAQVRVYSDPTFSPTPARVRPPRIRYLRPLIAREPAGTSWLFAATAVALAAAFLAVVLRFHVPASGSAEANVSLLTGRLIAEQHAMRYVPPDAFSFVGARWVPSAHRSTTADGAALREYVPKSPAGLPLLYAVCHWLALDDVEAARWAHLANPVAAALSVLAAFFICRFIAGSFLGLMAAAVMASSPLLFAVADEAGGDAVSLALVTWGFAMTLWWWRGGSAVAGFVAGALLGASATVNYTNALLVIALLLACAMTWHQKRPASSFLRAVVPLLGWLLPVALLLWWNQREMSAPTAFHVGAELPVLDADNLVRNWRGLLAALGSQYTFLLPLGALGLLTLLARRASLGLVVMAWFLLPILAYGAWVWKVTADAQLPFALAILPALLIGQTYLLRRLLFAPGDTPSEAIMVQDPYTGQSMPMVSPPASGGWRTVAAPLAAALVTGALVFVNLSGGAAGAQPVQGILAQSQQYRANLAGLASFVRTSAEPGAILIVDAPAQGDVLNMLSALGQWDLFDAEMFSPGFASRLTGPWVPLGVDGAPAPMSRRRYELLQELYAGATLELLSVELRRIADAAIAADRPVYLLMSPDALTSFTNAHLGSGYELKTVASHDSVPSEGFAEEKLQAFAGPQWVLARVLRAANPLPATVVTVR